MVKKLIGLSIFILILGGLLVSAEDVGVEAHTASVKWGDGSTTYSIYEFSNNIPKIAISLVNFGDDDIANMSLDYFGINTLLPSDVLAPSGLQSVNPNSIFWSSDYDNAVNVFLNITASQVNADTNYNWVVNTTDTQGIQQTNGLTLRVLNDSLAPRIDSVNPNNHKIIKDELTNIVLDYTEVESGFNHSVLLYRDELIYVSDIRGVATGTITSVCNATQCTFNLNPTTQMNLGSGFSYFDSYFELTDKAGNLNDGYLYHLYVDVLPPEVTLTTPADNVNISLNSYDYGFDVGDNAFGINANFNPLVNCTIYIDGIVKNETVRNSNALVSLAAYLGDLADGFHNWQVYCGDSAGWITSSEVRNFMLDTTGPAINLTNPTNDSVIANGWMINLTATDALSVVDTVWYTNSSGSDLSATSIGANQFQINTASWPEGINDIVVKANDSLGNIGTLGLTFKVDQKGPVVSLVSPADGTFNNNIFVVNPVDDYSTALDCNLWIDGIWNSSAATNSGTNVQFNTALGDGAYSWNVSCTDEVNNLGWSGERTVIIDTTIPVVNLIDPADGVNTNGVVNFNYDVLEANLDNCSLYLNGAVHTVNMNNNNFTGIGLVASNIVQTWYVSCDDQAANNGVSGTRQVYFDNILPVISNINNSEVTHTAAKISWTVDESSTNTVYYGTNAGNLSLIKTDVVIGTSPVIDLGLSASTLYYYLGQSCDWGNNCANSTVYNLTTSTTPMSPSGGGGGTTRGSPEEEEDNSCTENWNCGSWSSCVGGVQTRTCTDWNICGTNELEPTYMRSCEEEGEEKEETIIEMLNEGFDEEAGAGLITGAAIASANRAKENALAIGAVLGIAVLSGLLAWKRGAVVSGVNRIRNYRGSKTAKEEELVREKLRKSGIIK